MSISAVKVGLTIENPVSLPSGRDTAAQVKPAPHCKQRTFPHSTWRAASSPLPITRQAPPFLMHFFTIYPTSSSSRLHLAPCFIRSRTAQTPPKDRLYWTEKASHRFVSGVLPGLPEDRSTTGAALRRPLQDSRQDTITSAYLPACTLHLKLC